MLVYVKHVGLCAGPFWPKGYNLNNLGRGPLDEVHIKYQRPGYFGFRQEAF